MPTAGLRLLQLPSLWLIGLWQVVDGHKLDVKLAGANSVRQAIYFGNLSWDLDFDVLTSLCNKFGEIVSAKVNASLQAIWS